MPEHHNPEPFDITMIDDFGKEHKFHLTPRPFTDRKGNLVSTFIHFEEAEPGLIERMMSALPARRKGRALLDHLSMELLIISPILQGK